MKTIQIPAEIVALDAESGKLHILASNAREGGDNRGARALAKKSRELYAEYRRQLKEWFATAQEAL